MFVIKEQNKLMVIIGLLKLNLNFKQMSIIQQLQNMMMKETF